MAFLSEHIYSPVIVIGWVILLNFNLGFALASGSCGSEVHEDHGPSHAHHHCDHGTGHHRHDHHQHDREMVWKKQLPEELAEEEDLKLLGFGSDHHDHEHQDFNDLGLTSFGLWIHAIGCSLLVSLASLTCLIILPLILGQGKASKAIVDYLAVFGASAMLGDAFLHQLPHAFENVVRYVDDISGEVNSWSHGHCHHHYKNSKTLRDGTDAHDNLQDLSINENDGSILKSSSNGEVLDKVPNDCLNGEKRSEAALLQKRSTTTSAGEEKSNVDAANGSTYGVKSMVEKEPVQSPSSLVFGYLNLFSDGVIGDFGILLRSGFSVSTALFSNFLSALVAIVGTALINSWYLLLMNNVVLSSSSFFGFCFCFCM